MNLIVKIRIQHSHVKHGSIYMPLTELLIFYFNKCDYVYYKTKNSSKYFNQSWETNFECVQWKYLLQIWRIYI